MTDLQPGHSSGFGRHGEPVHRHVLGHPGDRQPAGEAVPPQSRLPSARGASHASLSWPARRTAATSRGWSPHRVRAAEAAGWSVPIGADKA